MLLRVAPHPNHQPTTAFIRQMADDGALFDAMIKELDIKLE
jgi:hypothetical protein